MRDVRQILMSQSISSRLRLLVRAKSEFAALHFAVAQGRMVQTITNDARILENCGTSEDR